MRWYITHHHITRRPHSVWPWEVGPSGQLLPFVMIGSSSRNNKTPRAAEGGAAAGGGGGVGGATRDHEAKQGCMEFGFDPYVPHVLVFWWQELFHWWLWYGGHDRWQWFCDDNCFCPATTWLAQGQTKRNQASIYFIWLSDENERLMSAFLASVSLKPCCHWKCHRRVQECALSGDSTLVFSQAITATSTLSFSTLGFPAGTSLQLLSWNATWLLFLLLRSKQQLNNPLRLHLCALYVHQAATEIHRSASLFQVLRLKLICGWSLRSSPKVSVSQWLGNMLKTGRLNIREGVNIVTPAP